MENLQKKPRIDIPKIREAANGEECTINSPYCNYDPSTVVLAHANDYDSGKGMGKKGDDTAGVFACSACHDWYDGRLGPNVLSRTGDEGLRLTLRATRRTIRRLVEMEVLK